MQDESALSARQNPAPRHQKSEHGRRRMEAAIVGIIRVIPGLPNSQKNPKEKTSQTPERTL